MRYRDQHLDVIVNKLKAKYKVEVELKAPTIPYRETIKSKIKVQGKHKNNQEDTDNMEMYGWSSNLLEI